MLMGLRKNCDVLVSFLLLRKTHWQKQHKGRSIYLACSAPQKGSCRGRDCSLKKRAMEACMQCPAFFLQPPLLRPLRISCLGNGATYSGLVSCLGWCHQDNPPHTLWPVSQVTLDFGQVDSYHRPQYLSDCRMYFTPDWKWLPMSSCL